MQRLGDDAAAVAARVSLDRCLDLLNIPLTSTSRSRIIRLLMARAFTAERELQGRSLSSFGALACTPGRCLDHEDRPGRLRLANLGRPVVRW